MVEHFILHSAQQEKLRNPNALWTPNFPIITIAGPSGTGKTSSTELLRQDFGIRPERNIKIGNLFREIFPDQVVDFQARNAEIDLRLEQKQQGLMLTATTEDPILVEARLSGYSAAKVSELTDKPIISFLLFCEEDERFRRIAKRQGISAEEARAKTLAREQGDLEWWRKLYPDLPEDIYNPAVKSTQGKPFYMYAIDTTHRKVPEVHQEMMRLLMRDGWASSNLNKPLKPTA